MVLVGCAVMPHAPMILNPDIEEALSLEGLRELNEACCKISAAVRERRPHLVLLCTPHGVNVEGCGAGVYMNSWARGTAEWAESFANVSVECELDMAASRSLLSALQAQGCNTKGLEMSGCGDLPAALCFSEVVPLCFLEEQLATTRVAILALGAPEGFSFVGGTGAQRAQISAELGSVTASLKLGHALSEWLDSQENAARRIFVIVSASLAQTHRTPEHCPRVPGSELYDARFLGEVKWGGSVSGVDMEGVIAKHAAAAETYDKAVELWCSTLRSEALLLTARKALPLAQPCGFAATVVLHGLLEGRAGIGDWKHAALATGAPTNVGLVAAMFLPPWESLPEYVQAVDRAWVEVDGDEGKLEVQATMLGYGGMAARGYVTKLPAGWENDLLTLEELLSAQGNQNAWPEREGSTPGSRSVTPRQQATGNGSSPRLDTSDVALDDAPSKVGSRLGTPRGSVRGFTSPSRILSRLATPSSVREPSGIFTPAVSVAGSQASPVKKDGAPSKAQSTTSWGLSSVFTSGSKKKEHEAELKRKEEEERARKGARERETKHGAAASFLERLADRIPGSIIIAELENHGALVAPPAKAIPEEAREAWVDRVAGLATCAAELGASGLVLVVPSEDFSSTVKQDVQFRFDRETAGAGCEALDLAGVPIAVLESNEDNAFTSTTGDELALAEGDWFTLSWFPRSRPAQALDGTSLSAAAQRAELGASLALGMSSYALDKGVVARRDEVNAEATATATAAEAARLREQLAAALKENAALQVRIDHLRAVVPPPLHEVAATLVRFMASGSVPESESGTEATQDNDLAIAPAEASDVAAATVVAFVTRSKLSLLQSATDVHELAPCSAAIVLQAYARRKLGRLLFLEQRARLKRFGGYSGKPHLSSSAPPPHAHLLGGTSALDEGEGGLRGQNRIAGLGGTVATPSRLLVAGSGTLDAPLQRSLQESASLAVTGEMFSNTRTSGPEVSWSAASGWSTAGATMRQAGWDPAGPGARAITPRSPRRLVNPSAPILGYGTGSHMSYDPLHPGATLAVPMSPRLTPLSTTFTAPPRKGLSRFSAAPFRVQAFNKYPPASTRLIAASAHLRNSLLQPFDPSTKEILNPP